MDLDDTNNYNNKNKIIRYHQTLDIKNVLVRVFRFIGRVKESLIGVIIVNRGSFYVFNSSRYVQRETTRTVVSKNNDTYLKVTKFCKKKNRLKDQQERPFRPVWLE